MKIHEQTIRFNEVMQILVNMKKEKSIRGYDNAPHAAFKPEEGKKYRVTIEEI